MLDTLDPAEGGVVAAVIIMNDSWRAPLWSSGFLGTPPEIMA